MNGSELMKTRANAGWATDRVCLLTLVVSLSFAVVSSQALFGADIFRCDFDDLPDTRVGAAVPAGWSGWYQSGGVLGTVQGVTHWSGEIGSPGRGGSGKCLRMWRAGTLFEDYTGALHAAHGSPFAPTANNFYVRWTMRLPAGIAMDFTRAGSNYQKLFRLNTNAGDGEIYFGINAPYKKPTIPAGAALQIAPFLHTDPVLKYATSNYTVLAPAEFAPLFDGQWHCYEVHLNTPAKTVEFWLDGRLKHRNIDLPMTAQSPTWLQHFGMGNRASGTVVQESWQAWEFDDLVIADAYVGPPGGQAIKATERKG